MDVDRPALDTSAAVLLATAAAAGAPAVQTCTPEQVRASHAAGSAFLTGTGEPVGEVRDDEMAGVPVRTYRPDRAGEGLVVYVHGGGWVVGTLDTYDPLCRALANRSRTRLVSVGYDLAPEARHPVQVGQVVGVVRQLLGAGNRVALAGDSAGAHLATLAAAAVAADGLALAALALIYPVVSPSLDTHSCTEVGSGYLLTADAMRWYWAQYLGPDLADRGASGVPADLCELELRVLPPALILTAGFDPLCDEGRTLADAIEAAHVPVLRLHYPGQMHGFVRASAQIPEGNEALERVGAFLGAAFPGRFAG